MSEGATDVLRVRFLGAGLSVARPRLDALLAAGVRPRRRPSDPAGRPRLGALGGSACLRAETRSGLGGASPLRRPRAGRGSGRGRFPRRVPGGRSQPTLK